MTSGTESSRLTYLDGVRGIAAWNVFIGHFLRSFPIPRNVETVGSTLADGAASVSLFFILSGLVLSYSYLAPGARTRVSIPSFWFRRFVRIVPAFFVVLVVSELARRTVFVDLSGANEVTEWLRSFWHQPFTIKALALQSIRLFRMFESGTLLPQGWTLQTELLLSLVVAFLIPAVREIGLGIVLFTLLAVRVLGAPAYLFHFTAGILIARYFISIQGWVRARSGAFRASALVVGLALYSFRVPWSRVEPDNYAEWLVSHPYWIYYVSGSGAAMLLVLVIGSPRLQRLFEKPVARYLGDISYSLYLCHFIVLLCLSAPLMHWMGRVDVLSWTLTLVVSTAATLALATALHRYVELPCMRVGKRILHYCAASPSR